MFNWIKGVVAPKRAALFFGRCNPPHKGHAKILERMTGYCLKNNCHGYFVLSKTHDSKNNPLDKFYRAGLIKLGVIDEDIITVSVADEFHPTIFHWLSYLYHGQNVTHVTVFCGDDRELEYTIKLNKYNDGILRDYGSYNFNKIDFVLSTRAFCAISSSDMRKYARDNKYESFRESLPHWLKSDDELALDVYNRTREGLK